MAMYQSSQSQWNGWIVNQEEIVVERSDGERELAEGFDNKPLEWLHDWMKDRVDRVRRFC